MNSFKELIIWQKGVDLTTGIYETTAKFPEHEKFGLISQLRRCAVSVPSNIAEGWGRKSTKDYIRFLTIARGSLMEMETQLIISTKLGYLDDSALKRYQSSLLEMLKMLNALISKLSIK